jgi:hypothetical protein|tara:strand:- start:2469 stop:2831 length:363 start_codon:yes stop_codon:yes gene_type:complete
MALKATSFDDALDYKIINESASTNSLNTNVTVAPGKLFACKLINGSSSAAFVKIFTDPTPTLGTTNPTLVFRVAGSATTVYDIPGGLDFNTLSFASTLNESPADTTAPSGSTVNVFLTCS